LPNDVAALLLPVVLLENILINTFYFVSALLLLERGEGTLAAQSVTPLRGDEYLASKVMTLTALSLVESLLIATAVAGLDGRLLMMSIGIALAATLFCLSGVALIVHYESINEFIMPSVLYTAVLSLPILGYFGVGAREWYLLHPIQGSLELMQMQTPYMPTRLAYAIGYPLLWLIPIALWSRRALRRLRSR
jgi:fluoroquinolone transport system permease protein